MKLREHMDSSNITKSQIDLWISRLNDDESFVAASRVFLMMGDAGFEAVWEAFNHPDSTTMHENARQILIQFGQKAADKVLLQMENDQVLFRSSCASIVGYLKDERAVKPLIKLSKSKESLYRNAAVKALHNIGDPSAVEALILRLRDRSNMVKFVAIRALGDIGDERAILPLENAKLKDPGAISARHKAIEAIKNRASLNASNPVTDTRNIATGAA